jgi:hypothetical protein
MQFEINITSHDLKVILTDLAGKSVVVSVKVKDREDVIEGVNVLKFDREEGVLTICSSIARSKVETLSYMDIECLVFQSFYKYAGEAAINFNVE